MHWRSTSRMWEARRITYSDSTSRRTQRNERAGAMRCPFCSENRDRVVDSRESRDGATIRRRRECLSCGRRFTSYEQIEDIPYMVVKHDGTREEFSRKKPLGGLLKAG